jgi:hypothetical protein
MTAKPILRVGKIKAMGRSTPHSVGGHLSRSRPTPNADSGRTPLNRWLVGTSKTDLNASINDVLTKAKLDRSELRTDAVIANDILLSVSPEWFRPDDPEAHGTWDDARLRSFTAEAQMLLKRTFGARLVSAVLHLDEATPHIQAVVVPIMRCKNDKPGFRLSSKDMFGPDQLSQLQQDWEDQLQPHGVGSRTKGSRARHTTLREYYSVLEAFEAEDERINLQISKPPSKPFLEASEAHQANVAEWQKAETKRLNDELRPLAVEASRGRLYDAEKRSATALRGELAAQSRDLSQTRLALADALEKVEMTKEQRDALRRTPINSVATMLGYTGEIKKNENAIDLVKRVGELDYNQALTWLAQRFGPDVAATAVREQAEQRVEEAVKAPLIFTKAEQFKVKAISNQLDALAAPGYRITVTTVINGKKIGNNLGKTESGEKFYSRNEVLNLVPDLIKMNLRGGNILLTPEDTAAHHVLIDDVSNAGLDELARRGYAPSVVLETSPNNFQAILKVSSQVPWDSMNEWFKDLNRDLGDVKITAPKHPMRLAGFENRKDKHQTEDGRFPWVRLVEAVNRFCTRSAEVIRAYSGLNVDTHQKGVRKR